MKRNPSRRNPYTIYGLDEFPKSQNFGESLLSVHTTPNQNIYIGVLEFFSTQPQQEMSFRVSKPNPYTKIEGPNHVSICSIPKLDKYHTQIPYKNTRLPYKTIAFHTFDIFFSFLLPSSLLFFFFSFFSLSLLFSSPKNERPLILSPFCLFSQDQNGIFLAF